MKVKALLFYSEWNKDRIGVEVSFGPDSVEIKNLEDQSVLPLKWSYPEVELEVGGSNNHLLFFKSKRNPADSFYIEARSELVLFLTSLEALPGEWREVINQWKKSKRLMMPLVLGSVLVVVLFFSALFAQRKPIAAYLTSKIPYESEVKIGERIFGLSFPPSKTLKDERVHAALEELIKPLRRAIPAPYNEFRVHIHMDGALNAFAMPGGQMVFNLGTLQRAQNGSEILGVAAHELAHVQSRHVLRGAIQGIGFFVIVQGLLGDVTGLLAVLADNSSFLTQQSFSREMESEADLMGFKTLVEAKITPLGMKSFFEKLLQEPRSGDAQVDQALKKLEAHTEFLSTHPNTQKRLEEIQKLYDNLDTSIKVHLQEPQKEFEALKKALKEDGIKQ